MPPVELGLESGAIVAAPSRVINTRRFWSTMSMPSVAPTRRLDMGGEFNAIHSLYTAARSRSRP